jgi:hypothetical protein
MNQRPVWCNSSTINIKQLMRSWKSCQGLPVSTDWAIHERHIDDAGWARDEECCVDVDRDGERFILPVMPAYFSKSMNTLQRGTQNSSWNLVIVDEKTKLKVFEILSGETLYLRSKSVRACGMNPRRRRSNEMSGLLTVSTVYYSAAFDKWCHMNFSVCPRTYWFHHNTITIISYFSLKYLNIFTPDF